MSINLTITNTGKQTKHGHAHPMTPPGLQTWYSAVSDSKSKTEFMLSLTFCDGALHKDRSQCVG